MGQVSCSPSRPAGQTQGPTGQIRVCAQGPRWAVVGEAQHVPTEARDPGASRETF